MTVAEVIYQKIFHIRYISLQNPLNPIFDKVLKTKTLCTFCL